MTTVHIASSMVMAIPMTVEEMERHNGSDDEGDGNGEA